MPALATTDDYRWVPANDPLFRRFTQKPMTFGTAVHMVPCFSTGKTSAVIGLASLEALGKRLEGDSRFEPLVVKTPEGNFGVVRLTNSFFEHSRGPSYNEAVFDFAVVPKGSSDAIAYKNEMTAVGALTHPGVRLYVDKMVLDQPAPIAAGRAIWGFPKAAGELAWTQSPTSETWHIGCGNELGIDARFGGKPGFMESLKVAWKSVMAFGLVGAVKRLRQKEVDVQLVSPEGPTQADCPSIATGKLTLGLFRPGRDQLRVSGTLLADLDFKPLAHVRIDNQKTVLDRVAVTQPPR